MRPDTDPSGRHERSFIEEARRAQIIAAATETVAEIGYAQASLAQIAERAGISKSVISYHFAGKDELLTQMVSGYFADAWAFMEERLDAETTAAGRMRVWVTSQLAYFGSHRAGFLAMVEIVTNHRAADGSRMFADDEEEVDALTEILEQGQRDGEFRDLDARSVAIIVIQCIEGVLGRWALDESTDLAAQAEVLTDFIDHAIRRQEGP